MVLDVLKENIVEILNVDPNEITESTSFIGDLCADSLDLYQIILGVESKLNISLRDEDFEQIFLLDYNDLSKTLIHSH